MSCAFLHLIDYNKSITSQEQVAWMRMGWLPVAWVLRRDGMFTGGSTSRLLSSLEGGCRSDMVPSPALDEALCPWTVRHIGHTNLLKQHFHWWLVLSALMAPSPMPATSPNSGTCRGLGSGFCVVGFCLFFPLVWFVLQVPETFGLVSSMIQF